MKDPKELETKFNRKITKEEREYELRVRRNALKGAIKGTLNPVYGRKLLSQSYTKTGLEEKSLGINLSVKIG